MKRLFLYLKYYFQPKDRYVRKLALEACRRHFLALPVRNPNNPYPRVGQYQKRLEETLRYQRAFNDSYRHRYAISKLSENHPR